MRRSTATVARYSSAGDTPAPGGTPARTARPGPAPGLSPADGTLGPAGGPWSTRQGTGIRAIRRRVSPPMRLVSLPTQRPWEVT